MDRDWEALRGFDGAPVTGDNLAMAAASAATVGTARPGFKDFNTSERLVAHPLGASEHLARFPCPAAPRRHAVLDRRVL